MTRPALLQECVRISHPGGIVRLTEAEWAFINSAAFDQLTGLGNLAARRSGHTFSPHGRTIETTPMLLWLLQQAGYEVLGQRAHVVDYSAGTEAHESNTQLFLVFYKLYQPFPVQCGL